jgi:hypothetical protein
MKNFYRILLILFLLFILSNCTSKIDNNQNVENNSSPHDSITLSSDIFGAVKGTIQTEEPTDRIGLILYLGEVITDSNGMFGGFLNPETAPVAIYDSTSGEFSFSNVQPGEYSLIIHEVVLGGQALMDENGSVVIIQVEQGLITDLGIISFDGF